MEGGENEDAGVGEPLKDQSYAFQAAHFGEAEVQAIPNQTGDTR